MDGPFTEIDAEELAGIVDGWNRAVAKLSKSLPSGSAPLAVATQVCTTRLGNQSDVPLLDHNVDIALCLVAFWPGLAL
jgi:hypothetical protein